MPFTDATTPAGRLTFALAFLVDREGGSPGHNDSLLALARRLDRGEAVDWNTVFDVGGLVAVRDDLDRLPRSARSWSVIAELIRSHRLVVVAGEGRRPAE